MTHTTNKNKNDIFNAPSPILTPAPKLPSLRPTPTHTPIPTPTLPKLPTLPSLRISTSTSTPSPEIITHPPPPSSSLPGRARSPPVSTLDIRIRLILSNQYLLGIGSHSDVYLGSYRFRFQQANPSSKSRRSWHLCAIKRLHPDRESLLLGLDEVFVLRRLGPHPNVVRLIDVRDEVDLVPERGAGGTHLLSTRLPLAGRRFISSSTTTKQDSSSSSTARAKQQPLSAVLRPNPGTPVEHRLSSLSASSSLTPYGMRSIKGLSPSSTTAELEPDSPQRPNSTFLAAPTQRSTRLHQSHHARSTSDTYGDRSPTPPTGRVPDPSPPSTSTSVDNPPSPSLLPSSENTNQDPPRMLLLLELLPHQLSTYARLHPHRVTYPQWLQWAHNLLSALSFFHARNLAHADIKKENCLLTEELVLKVGDLGSARWMDVGNGNGGGGGGGAVGGAGLGTLAYSAPELARTGVQGGGGAFGGGARRYVSSEAGGEQGNVFGVKVDIWSAGAVLYSLAIDQPPFARARSTLDILNRKRNFFQTEEADRTSRFDLEVGMSAISSRPGSRASVGAGNGVGSRTGSLRGRKGVGGARGSSENLMGAGGSSGEGGKVLSLGLGAPPPSSPSKHPSGNVNVSASGHSHSHSYPSLLLRQSAGASSIPSSSSMATIFGREEGRERERDSSTDSVDSLASSIQNMDGRSPSALAVAALLADDGEVEVEVESEADGGGGGPVRRGVPTSTTTSVGLLAAPAENPPFGSASGAGAGDSSPLRKGTAALLSHSQSRQRCPPGLTVDSSSSGGASLFPAAGGGVGVRRTPSMPFRYGAGSAAAAAVSRHHSVKLHAGPAGAGAGGLGLGMEVPSSSVARGRATSIGNMGGNVGGSGLRAVVNAPGPVMGDGLMEVDGAGSGMGVGVGSNASSHDDDFFYAPPTPIAETGEGEDGDEDGGYYRSFDTSTSTSTSVSPKKRNGNGGGGRPSVPLVRGMGYRGQRSFSGQPQPHPQVHAHTHTRKAPSISSLSSASTAGSYPPSETSSSHSSSSSDEEEERRAYVSDGAPAIVLPGGGRLPDAARELLRAMLETDPRRRPSAVEVLGVLERL